MSIPLLNIQDLVVGLKNSIIINHASLDVSENEIVALVGESGSGKSMIARAIMGLFPSPLIFRHSGSIFFQKQPLHTYTERQLRKIRGHGIAYIPQSPLNALNPIMSIGRQIIESQLTNHSKARERALFLLHRVGFSDPELTMKSLPYQLSGGMRQRVLIAIALMNSPKLLIADEPTTALDVTLQAEILSLLQDLKEEYGLGILFITHDLGIVARSADRVVILQSGKTIESGNADAIFYHPQLPYTQLLIKSLDYQTAMVESTL